MKNLISKDKTGLKRESEKLEGGCNLQSLFLKNQLCFSLYAASLAMTKLYRPLLVEAGITYPQYVVLLALWETDGLTVSMLGAKVSLDSGTLTPLLKRMEKARLIGRNRNPSDEREVIISLSASGRKMHAKASEIGAEVSAATVLSPDAARKLTRALSRLRLVLAAHGSAPKVEE